MFTGLLKDMIKDAAEQPDEEIHGVRSGSVLSAGVSVPVGWDMVTLSAWMCSSTWKFLEPSYFWDFVKASSHRHDQ